MVADYALTAERIEDVVAKLAARPTYAEDMTRRDVASHTPRADDHAAGAGPARRAGTADRWAGWTPTASAPEEQAVLRRKLTEA